MRSDTEIEVLPLGEAAKSVPKYWTGHELSNGRGELGEVEMVPKPTLIRAFEMYNFRHAK